MSGCNEWRHCRRVWVVKHYKGILKSTAKRRCSRPPANEGPRECFPLQLTESAFSREQVAGALGCWGGGEFLLLFSPSDAYSVSGGLSPTTKAVRWSKAGACKTCSRKQVPPLTSTLICDQNEKRTLPPSHESLPELLTFWYAWGHDSNLTCVDPQGMRAVHPKRDFSSANNNRSHHSHLQSTSRPFYDLGLTPPARWRKALNFSCSILLVRPGGHKEVRWILTTDSNRAVWCGQHQESQMLGLPWRSSS